MPEYVKGFLIASAFVLGSSGTWAQVIYWTDFDADGAIFRADLDTMVMEHVVRDGVDMPYRMAIDPVGRKMYWTQPYSWEVKRANLDGSDLESLIQLEPG